MEYETKEEISYGARKLKKRQDQDKKLHKEKFALVRTDVSIECIEFIDRN